MDDLDITMVCIGFEPISLQYYSVLAGLITNKPNVAEPYLMKARSLVAYFEPPI